MTEDAIYAALMDIQRELGEQSNKLDNIDGRLDNGDTRMGRIETKLDGRPCISQQGPCPTQQVALPPAATQTQQDPQSAEAQAIGNIVIKAWSAIPHGWRFAIVLGAGVGGGSQVKPLLQYLANNL